MLVEVTRVEEVSSSEVGSSGKVSLLESSASRCRFLPSSLVLGRAITACAIKASSGSCHQGECECLKQVKGRRIGLIKSFGGSSKLWRRQRIAIFSEVAGR